MVYVPSDVNSWQAYAQSWLEQFLRRQLMWQEEQQEQAPISCGASQGRDQSVRTGSTASAPGSQPGVITTADSTPEVDTFDFMWAMLNRFVDPLLDWLHANGKEHIPQEDISRITALTVLLESLVVQSR
jgi:hypothetical protein